MKYSVLSALIGATTAHADAPAYYNEPPFSVATHPAAAGLVQVESACAMFGVDGVTCAPANNELFATGMNGDEDLGEDITMKGDKFHFQQMAQAKFATGMNGDEDLTCVLTEIDSCNSPITHSDNWCWMKMSFSNCKSIEFSSGKCKTPTTRGKCNKSRINGNIIRIDLHSDYWKGNKKEAIPAGFSIYTDKNSSARFGTTGKETKTWKGRGRIVGASYDVSGEADFLQFKMCNDDSWWKQPAKTEQVCQSQNIAAKSVVWAADMLGVKCDGSTTAASALVSGAAILLSYSMLF